MRDVCAGAGCFNFFGFWFLVFGFWFLFFWGGYLFFVFLGVICFLCLFYWFYEMLEMISWHRCGDDGSLPSFITIQARPS
jgi:hypothetical protein